MGTNSKTPGVLDDMLEHVHYEAAKVFDFCRIGNAWCDGLPAPLDKYSRESILEAALIHFRSVIEFLGNDPKGDRVTARDYVKHWSWTISGELVKVSDLHGRVAHLGIVRASVATTGDFMWSKWLNEHAPIVLGAFRNFLRRLSAKDPRRFALLDRGLLDDLDSMLGT